MARESKKKKMPYMQLFTSDFTKDEKLRYCEDNPETIGVYIYLLCYLHQQKEPGKLKLHKKFEEITSETTFVANSETKVQTKCTTNDVTNDVTNEKFCLSNVHEWCSNFAKELKMLGMPFDIAVVCKALQQLLFFNIIEAEAEDVLIQKRMVADEAKRRKISEIRSRAGSTRKNKEHNTATTSEANDETKGTTKVQTKCTTKNKHVCEQNSEQTSEIENEYTHIIYNNSSSDDNKGVQGEKKKSVLLAPPTLEEVQKYFTEINKTGAKDFFCYYEANGWVQGNSGKPIQNWKAAALGWDETKYAKGSKDEQRAQRTAEADRKASEERERRRTEQERRREWDEQHAATSEQIGQIIASSENLRAIMRN